MIPFTPAPDTQVPSASCVRLYLPEDGRRPAGRLDVPR